MSLGNTMYERLSKMLFLTADQIDRDWHITMTEHKLVAAAPQNWFQTSNVWWIWVEMKRNHARKHVYLTRLRNWKSWCLLSDDGRNPAKKIVRYQRNFTITLLTLTAYWRRRSDLDLNILLMFTYWSCADTSHRVNICRQLLHQHTSFCL